MMSAPIAASTKLRQLLAEPGRLIVCPGVYDGIATRIALKVGFDCLYMVCSASRPLLILKLQSLVKAHKQTGAGSAASRLGQADLGIISLPDMRANAEMIANLDPSVPVIADADTGYGGPIMVARTVEQYAQAGVAGCHIEDQVQTKRCAHLQGKELVSADTFVMRIRAAVQARQRARSDIVIIARTDALQGLGFEECVTRLKGAIAVGADVAFIEGLASVEQCERAVRELAPTPVMLNIFAGAAKPAVSQETARKVGLKILVYPHIMMMASVMAGLSELQNFKSTGDYKAGAETWSMKNFFELMGLDTQLKIDQDAGGSSYSTSV